MQYLIKRALVGIEKAAVKGLNGRVQYLLHCVIFVGDEMSGSSGAQHTDGKAVRCETDVVRYVPGLATDRWRNRIRC